MAANAGFTHAEHGFGPVFDERSEILILGSFPSVASRKASFFYGHPQNRFWKVLQAVYQEDPGDSIASKTDFCLHHKIALYDSIESCSIRASSDASIRDVVPADLSFLYARAKIRLVIWNGKTSARCFEKFQSLPGGVRGICLPSTSPANAAVSLNDLIEIWGKALR